MTVFLLWLLRWGIVAFSQISCGIAYGICSMGCVSCTGSVCPYVTVHGVHCLKTAKHIVKIFKTHYS